MSAGIAAAKKSPKVAKPAKPAKRTITRNVPRRIAGKVGGKEQLMSLLLAPHVSEKAARAAETANHAVFRVRGDASKPQIKAAVELMFDVKVQAVQVVNVAGKVKRFGQRFGRRSDIKKAYVRLAEGQSIDLSGLTA
jgi:large subunit ribosomal protein L23